MLRRTSMNNLRLTAALMVAFMGLMRPTSRASADNVLRADFDVQTVNPCSGEIVTGMLNARLMVNTVMVGNGAVHVNINGGFQGQLSGDQGNTYQVSAQGHDSFDALAAFYDADFSVHASSRGSGPNLTLDGVVRVFVDADGNPLAAHILSVNATCG